MWLSFRVMKGEKGKRWFGRHAAFSNSTAADPLELFLNTSGFVARSSSVRSGHHSGSGNATIDGDKGLVRLVVFPPSFAVNTRPDFFRTLHQRASTVLHEVSHYVRPRSEGANFIDDPAYGLPAFDGTPKRSPHNYTQLTANEAMHCAEC